MAETGLVASTEITAAPSNGTLERPPRRDGAALLSAVVLALALLGDALLYLVLPVHTAVFGVEGAWVGVLLSANRFVRLGVNVLLVPVARWIGLGGLTVLGAALAAGSTLGYAVLTGGVALLLMRLAWGTAYSALRLSQLGFATDTVAGTGRRLGRSFAVTQLGPLVAVTAGPVLVGVWGVRPAFVILGLLSVVGIAVARRLPKHAGAQPVSRTTRRYPYVPFPTRTDIVAFLFTLASNGVFVVAITPLLVREGCTPEAAIAAGGVVLMVRRLTAVVLGPTAGQQADRLGLERVFRFVLAGVALAMLAVAAGASLAGLIVTAGVVAVLHTLAPGVAAARSGERRLHGLASFATWSDLGAAAGALAAGSLLGVIDIRLLFAAAAGLALIALIVEGSGARRPPEQAVS